jgi:hypothetical protein
MALGACVIACMGGCQAVIGNDPSLSVDDGGIGSGTGNPGSTATSGAGGGSGIPPRPTGGTGGGGATGADSGPGSGGATGTDSGTGMGTDGGTGPGSDSGPPPPTCDLTVKSFAPARVWQLTDEQYVNVVRDVLGITLTGSDTEITTVKSTSGIFANYSESKGLVSLSAATSYQTAAGKVGAQAETKIQTLLGLSSATAVPTATQVATFIKTKLARLFRRPLTDAEVTVFTDIYNAGVPAGAPKALGWLIQTALQSPSFIYRTELGTNAATSTEPIKLTAHELASALSFLFLDTSPDDALWAKAEAGTLLDPAVLATEVNRLLALPAAQANLGLQSSYWLQLEKFPARSKDRTLFPEFTDTLHTTLYKSALSSIEDMVLRGNLADLFTSTKMYVNAEMGTVYGIAGATGSSLVSVTVNKPERNAGLLTHPGLLAASNQRMALGDPVHRGLLIYDSLLCGGTAGALPPPPADANAIAATMVGTERELATQRSKLSCGACHALFDPVGLAFERYDAIGRYSETRYVASNAGMTSWATATSPIDTSSTLSDRLGSEIAGPVAGVAELSARLRTGTRLAFCAASHLAEYSLGHDPNAQNSCELQAVKDGFAKSGSFVDLYRSLITSPGFVLRATVVK